MKVLTALKSVARTAVNVAAKNPMRTLVVVIAISIVVIAATAFMEVASWSDKEGMRNGGLTVRAVPSKYPFWGRKGTKNEGLRCKKENAECTTFWKNGALMDREPASAANLVPWPTSQIPGGPGQILLTAYKKNILKTHAKNTNLKTMADVEKIWGLYRNPYNGLYEILVMSADVPAKQAASAETWRRTKLMVDLVAKTGMPRKFVKKLRDFVNIPKKYGRLSPISECDNTIGSRSGAFASNIDFKGGKIPHVCTLWRVPARDVAPGETMADKRFGIIIHEMTHVACHNPLCAGLDPTGHCGEQHVVERALREVCAKHGLKPQLSESYRKSYAEKCAKFAASRS